MELREFFSEDAIKLDLAGTTKDDVLRELISLLKLDEKSEQGGEQTPVYSIGFELFENGVSRALILDYTDFTIKGEMTSLDLKDGKPCP